MVTRSHGLTDFFSFGKQDFPSCSIHRDFAQLISLYIQTLEKLYPNFQVLLLLLLSLSLKFENGKFSIVIAKKARASQENRHFRKTFI